MLRINPAVSVVAVIAKRRKPSEIDGIITEILAQSSQPIGAYEIARRAKAMSHRLSPTQVYRSLERMLTTEEVERVASLNAYIIANGKEHVHLLCQDCGTVVSVEEILSKQALLRIADAEQFHAISTHIEILGHCESCSAKKRSMSDVSMENAD